MNQCNDLIHLVFVWSGESVFVRLDEFRRGREVVLMMLRIQFVINLHGVFECFFKHSQMNHCNDFVHLVFVWRWWKSLCHARWFSKRWKSCINDANNSVRHQLTTKCSKVFSNTVEEPLKWFCSSRLCLEMVKVSLSG